MNTPTNVIARRLGNFIDLTSAETMTLQSIGSGRTHSWSRQAIIQGPRKSSPSPLYITSGWAAHSRVLSDGRRQLIDLLLPGDMVRVAAHGAPGQAIICLTPVTTIDGARIIEAGRDSREHPGIAKAIEYAVEEERQRVMNHVVRLGRLTAYERLANLFVELYRRFDAVGLVQGEALEFPLTQGMLGDLLGLSSVHVNRSLQALRRVGLANISRGQVHFPDIEALERAGGYRHHEAVRTQTVIGAPTLVQ